MRRTVYTTMMAVCAALLVAGCGVAPNSEALGTDADELQIAPQVERPAELLPMRSEDLVDIAAMDATLNAACPTAFTCDASFGSCASWSSTTSCGFRQCGSQCFRCTAIKPGLEPICTSGIRRTTFSSRFRVCFNALGQSCTEFQVFSATACQLSGDCCDLAPPELACGQDL